MQLSNRTTLYNNTDIEGKIIKLVEMFINNDIKPYEEYFNCQFRRFRLLYIINNSQRLKAISKIVKEHDNSGFIWLTTLEQFNQKGVLAPIWNVPANNKLNLSII